MFLPKALDESLAYMYICLYCAVTFSRVDPGGKLIMGARKATYTADMQVRVSTELVFSGMFFCLDPFLFWIQSFINRVVVSPTVSQTKTHHPLVLQRILPPLMLPLVRHKYLKN